MTHGAFPQWMENLFFSLLETLDFPLNPDTPILAFLRRQTFFYRLKQNWLLIFYSNILSCSWMQFNACSIFVCYTIGPSFYISLKFHAFTAHHNNPLLVSLFFSFLYIFYVFTFLALLPRGCSAPICRYMGIWSIAHECICRQRKQ